MNGMRLLHTLRLWTIRNSGKRADYLRKKKVFFSIGENVTIMDRTVPLYAKLIKIGNNVHIASNVNLVTHDVAFKMLNGIRNNTKSQIKGEKLFREKVGCIEIGDNVFIGSGTRILYDVKIGCNCVIGAGTLVNKDIPSNSVVAGVPARVIGSFDDFLKKREKEVIYPEGLEPKSEGISPNLVDYLWEQFDDDRSNG